MNIYKPVIYSAILLIITSMLVSCGANKPILQDEKPLNKKILIISGKSLNSHYSDSRINNVLYHLSSSFTKDLSRILRSRDAIVSNHHLNDRNSPISNEVGNLLEKYKWEAIIQVSIKADKEKGRNDFSLQATYMQLNWILDDKGAPAVRTGKGPSRTYQDIAKHNKGMTNVAEDFSKTIH